MQIQYKKNQVFSKKKKEKKKKKAKMGRIYKTGQISMKMQSYKSIDGSGKTLKWKNTDNLNWSSKQVLCVKRVFYIFMTN